MFGFDPDAAARAFFCRCGSAAASAVTDEKRAEPKAAPPICFTASRREIPLLPLSIALALSVIGINSLMSRQPNFDCQANANAHSNPRPRQLLLLTVCV